MPLIAMSDMCTLSPTKNQTATLPSGQQEDRGQQNNKRTPEHAGT